MNKKNQIIVGLLVIASISFVIFQFLILPAQQKELDIYHQNQTDALSHDITSIKKFQHPYIGNTSNVINLFNRLPLNHIDMKFAINSNQKTLTVKYSGNTKNIGTSKIQRDLLYNSVVAMATIDNLSAITYNFRDNSYQFGRDEIESIFSEPLSTLLESEQFQQKLNTKLKDDQFLRELFKKQQPK